MRIKSILLALFFVILTSCATHRPSTRGFEYEWREAHSLLGLEDRIGEFPMPEIRWEYPPSSMNGEFIQPSAFNPAGVVYGVHSKTLIHEFLHILLWHTNRSRYRDHCLIWDLLQDDYNYRQHGCS